MQKPAIKQKYHPDTVRIKVLMWTQKRTFTDLAAKAGCRDSTIHRVVNGSPLIKDNGEWLRFVAKELGVPLSSIVLSSNGSKKAGSRKPGAKSTNGKGERL